MWVYGIPRTRAAKAGGNHVGDAVGYSRLMGLDEAETLSGLSELRPVVDGLTEQRGGRMEVTAGDSVLAEFPSVVEAAAFAVEVQQASHAMNASAQSGSTGGPSAPPRRERRSRHRRCR
jgi:class 3 adenylate cyclase